MRTRRRASILAMALVALLVVALWVAAMMQLVLNDHRQLLRVEQHEQAHWLAVSAVERAQSRLSKEPDYTGERWEIPAGQLDGQHPTQVMIHVESTPGASRQRLIRVQIFDPDSTAQQLLLRHERLTNILRPGGSP